MPCNAMQCDAVRCDAMRCGAMRCDAVRCDAIVEIEQFLGSSAGLPSRFPRDVRFPDFTDEELVQV